MLGCTLTDVTRSVAGGSFSTTRTVFTGNSPVSRRRTVTVDGLAFTPSTGRPASSSATSGTSRSAPAASAAGLVTSRATLDTTCPGPDTPASAGSTT